MMLQAVEPLDVKPYKAVMQPQAAVPPVDATKRLYEQLEAVPRLGLALFLQAAASKRKRRATAR